MNFRRFTKDGLELQRRIDKTPLLDREVAYFGLSIRTINALDDAGVRTFGEVTRKTEREMLRKPNFGRKSLAELKSLLYSFGLDFAPDERHRR